MMELSASFDQSQIFSPNITVEYFCFLIVFRYRFHYLAFQSYYYLAFQSYYQSGGDSQQYKSEYHEEHRTQSQQSQQQQYQQRHEEHQRQQTTTSAPAQSYSTSQHTESHTTHTVPVQQVFLHIFPRKVVLRDAKLRSRHTSAQAP